MTTIHETRCRLLVAALIMAGICQRPASAQSLPRAADVGSVSVPVTTATQEPMPPMPGMDMSGMSMASPAAWRFMSDGVLFGTFNNQGSPRGDTEFRAQNWWMGTWSRPVGAGTLQFNTMLSLDPATVGSRGYSEIFQTGETLDGRPIVDRQHPHDFLMQLAAVWRRPFGGSWTWTLAGAPVGEPALGPVAFMHRASAMENPVAPLGHHTMDSSHVAMGVITTGLVRGAWTGEASLFNGREPDEQRWDLMDPGPLDSWSARLSWQPRPNWEVQASHGFLEEPEPLEPGDLRRTTASVSWLRITGENFSAVSAVVGRNDSDLRDASGGLVEFTRRKGRYTGYGRLEIQQVDTALLLTGDSVEGNATFATVAAVTVGGVRELVRARRIDLALGADITAYHVPEVLRSAYGSHPVSFHVFLRLRPAASAMGRMWNMTMTRPMAHAATPAAHQH